MLIYWALPWFAWLAWHWRATSSPTTFLTIGVLLVLLCERYAFGYAITLCDDRLIYRDRGWLFGRETALARTDIVRAIYSRSITNESKPLQRVEIEYRSSAGGQTGTQVLSLATFRRRDVERLLHWLPNVVRE